MRRLLHSFPAPSHPAPLPADFSGGSAPKISVCSASDMLSLSPSDILTKLRLFLYLICGLFGGMHLGCAIGWARDEHDRRRALAAVLEPGNCGFVVEGAELAWTWLLEQALAMFTIFTTHVTA